MKISGSIKYGYIRNKKFIIYLIIFVIVVAVITAIIYFEFLKDKQEDEQLGDRNFTQEEVIQSLTSPECGEEIVVPSEVIQSLSAPE